MNNLYGYDLNLNTGKANKYIDFDVIDVNGCIVRKNYKKQDLENKNYTHTQCLDKFYINTDSIAYFSFKEEIDIEELKSLAMRYIKHIKEKKVIDKIKNLKESDFK
jgi:hypothetical protein